MSEFYRELRRPSYRRANVHRRLALELLDGAPRNPNGSAGAAGESAITRLRLSRAHAPDEPEILFRLGMLLASELGPRRRNAERRVDEAIEVLTALRRLDPNYEPFLVGTELAVLYTRKLDFESAMREYEAAMPRAMLESRVGGIYANYAEVSMHAGDLVGAIERYEHALALETRSGRSARSLGLILFGLAVALDRVGESGPALERAVQAVTASGGSMDLLTSDGVFFEPTYELRYYQAMGSLALARRAADNNERVTQLEAALRSFRQFLDEGGRQSPYADVAERRITDTETLLAAARPSTTPHARARRAR